MPLAPPVTTTDFPTKYSRTSRRIARRTSPYAASPAAPINNVFLKPIQPASVSLVE